MNGWWLVGCSVALTTWVAASFVVFSFGLAFGPTYPVDVGIGMFAVAVIAPAVVRLIRSYRLRRVGPRDGLAIVALLPALALLVWAIQQVASPRPAYPLLDFPSESAPNIDFAAFATGNVVGAGFITLGAAAKRHPYYGNRARLAAIVIGVLIVLLTLSTFGSFLVFYFAHGAASR